MSSFNIELLEKMLGDDGWFYGFLLTSGRTVYVTSVRDRDDRYTCECAFETLGIKPDLNVFKAPTSRKEIEVYKKDIAVIFEAADT